MPCDIHPEHARDDRQRQRQHRHDGEDEERLVGLLVDQRDQFFLQQPDPLDQRRRIGNRSRELLGRLAQVGEVRVGDPRGRPVQQAEERRRFGRQQPLQPHQHAPQRAQRRTGWPGGARGSGLPPRRPAWSRRGRSRPARRPDRAAGARAVRPASGTARRA